MESEWNKEINKSLKTQNGSAYKPSLTKAIARAFGPRFLALGVYIFFDEFLLRILPPFFMKWLIEYFSSEDHSGISYLEVCTYGIGLVLAAVLSITIRNQFFFGTSHIGMKLRVAHSSLIYKKVIDWLNSL